MTGGVWASDFTAKRNVFRSYGNPETDVIPTTLTNSLNIRRNNNTKDI
jgi:hypothetical protein